MRDIYIASDPNHVRGVEATPVVDETGPADGHTTGGARATRHREPPTQAGAVTHGHAARTREREPQPVERSGGEQPVDDLVQRPAVKSAELTSHCGQRRSRPLAQTLMSHRSVGTNGDGPGDECRCSSLPQRPTHWHDSPPGSGLHQGVPPCLPHVPVRDHRRNSARHSCAGWWVASLTGGATSTGGVQPTAWGRHDAGCTDENARKDGALVHAGRSSDFRTIVQLDRPHPPRSAADDHRPPRPPVDRHARTSR